MGITCSLVPCQEGLADKAGGGCGEDGIAAGPPPAFGALALRNGASGCAGLLSAGVSSVGRMLGAWPAAASSRSAAARCASISGVVYCAGTLGLLPFHFGRYSLTHKHKEGNYIDHIHL